MSSVPEPGDLQFVDSMSPQGTAQDCVVDEGPPAELLVRNQEVSRLIYNPGLEQVREKGQVRAFRVHGKVEGKAIAWGFWGAFIIVMVLALVVVFRGATGLYSTWDMFWVMLGLTIGALLFKSGRRSSQSKELLCEIDLVQQMMLWPTGPETMLAVPFDEVTELVFGMTYYPVSEQRSDVMVHAFTLLVRDSQNRLIPIVEASPDKEETHEIAKFIGHNMSLPLTYVGLGIK